MRRILLLLAVVVGLAVALGNTPGQHSVTLTWTASATPNVTYNLYRGTAAGVCGGTPTPYVKGITAPTYTDTNALSDGQTLFYNVSAVKNGGESACDGEIQVLIPVLPLPPSGLAGGAS